MYRAKFGQEVSDQQSTKGLAATKVSSFSDFSSKLFSEQNLVSLLADVQSESPKH
jgi:hypothetical protein